MASDELKTGMKTHNKKVQQNLILCPTERLLQGGVTQLKNWPYKPPLLQKPAVVCGCVASPVPGMHLCMSCAAWHSHATG